jgi:hypothetical protein
MAGPTLLRRLRTFLAGATGGAGFTNAVPAEAGSIFSLLRSMWRKWWKELRLFASFERDAVFSSAAVKHWL